MSKLSAVLSKKVPIPGLEYSSQQFSCGLELDLPGEQTQDSIRQKIHNLYALLHSAIDEEIRAALSAGRSVIKADVYAGTVSDAKVIGLQANQHGLALNLSERKAALDELLNAGNSDFTDAVLARMTGLDRHTVERRRRERQSGDFIAAAGRIRRVKTPEELMTQAARTFAAEVEKHGIDVVLKALELLPLHIREDVVRRLVSEGSTPNNV